MRSTNQFVWLFSHIFFIVWFHSARSIFSFTFSNQLKFVCTFLQDHEKKSQQQTRKMQTHCITLVNEPKWLIYVHAAEEMESDFKFSFSSVPLHVGNGNNILCPIQWMNLCILFLCSFSSVLFFFSIARYTDIHISMPFDMIPVRLCGFGNCFGLVQSIFYFAPCCWITSALPIYRKLIGSD